MSSLVYKNIISDFDPVSMGVMLGVMLAGCIFFIIGGLKTDLNWIPAAESTVSGLNWSGFLIGGLFVGIGTKVGGGCTSGHGICGMPRWSIRSWIAVPVFMGFAVLTANVLREIGWTSTAPGQVEWSLGTRLVLSYIFLGVMLCMIAIIYSGTKEDRLTLKKFTVALLVGAMFGLGLIVS